MLDKVNLLFQDMSMALDRIVPESLPWLHTSEGAEYVFSTHWLLITHTSFVGCSDS
jgi:thiamine phosphate synthase YjbQ (UPF0047 family)